MIVETGVTSGMQLSDNASAEETVQTGGDYFKLKRYLLTAKRKKTHTRILNQTGTKASVRFPHNRCFIECKKKRKMQIHLQTSALKWSV